MSDLSEIKSIIQSHGEAWDQFKKANDELLKAKAEGKAVADLEAKVERLSGALDDLQEQKDKIEARLNRPGAGSQPSQDEAKQLAAFNREVKAQAAAFSKPQPADVTAEEYAEYKRVFAEVMRKGDKAMLDAERKAMSVGTDPDGGYLVPVDMSGRIVTRLRDLSPIRAIANVQAISSGALEGIEDIDEAAAGWVAELGTRSDTTTPQLGKYRITAEEMYAQPKATQTLLDDAAVDIEQWLADKVADKFARTEGAAFVAGNGVGKPKGFTAYTTAATADGSRTWGQLEHVVTGANGAFNGTNPADVLFDLEGAFKPGHLTNAVWVTRRSIITLVRKFKDDQKQYLWQPGLQAGRPATLIGYPIVMAEDMPTLATGSLSLALGDFQAGYTIVDRLGVRVLRDPYTDKPYVKFYTTKRTGGGVVNFEAIKFVKFSS